MRKAFATLMVGAGLVALSAAAAADPHSGVSVSFGFPPPVYAPAPMAHHARVTPYYAAPAAYPQASHHEASWASEDARRHRRAEHYARDRWAYGAHQGP